MSYAYLRRIWILFYIYKPGPFEQGLSMRIHIICVGVKSKSMKCEVDERIIMIKGKSLYRRGLAEYNESLWI